MAVPPREDGHDQSRRKITGERSPLGRVELVHIGLGDDVLGKVLAERHLLAVEPVGGVLDGEGAVAFRGLVGNAEEPIPPS